MSVVRVKLLFILMIVVLILVSVFAARRKRPADTTKCPKVKAIRNFNLGGIVGKWYVIQYYASSEEALPYRCMRADFKVPNFLSEVTMDFSYSFSDDPLNEQLNGNITWSVPNLAERAHWTHTEDNYEGIYNTYVIDSDYKTWMLLLHCAEKSTVPKYLSSFLMGRQISLGINVISYLRDKLSKYDIDLNYMFMMSQNDCDSSDTTWGRFELPRPIVIQEDNTDQHPLKYDVDD